MTDYPEIAARFARDTAKHEMTVKHEDGLYRHLKFMNPEHGSFGAFELITWPYNLVVKTGWTFHFDIDATPDMFDLFRRTALTGQINPGYWSEKVRAGRDEVEGYDPDLLKGEVASTLAQWMRDDLADRVWQQAKELGFTEKELRDKPGLRKELARQVRQEWRAANRELREAVHEHFFSDMADYNIEYESEAHRALHDFSYRPEGSTSEYPYYFADWHEWRLKGFTPGFLRSCYAIRHGIDLWDAARKTAEVAAFRAEVLIEGADAVLKSSHGEPMRDAHNAQMRDVGLLRRLAAGKPEEPVAPAETAVEYAVRIPGGRVLQDGNAKDRAEQVERLDRYRGKALWPEAVLVQRTVAYGEWTEAAQ